MFSCRMMAPRLVGNASPSLLRADKRVFPSNTFLLLCPCLVQSRIAWKLACPLSKLGLAFPTASAPSFGTRTSSATLWKSGADRRRRRKKLRNGRAVSREVRRASCRAPLLCFMSSYNRRADGGLETASPRWSRNASGHASIIIARGHPRTPVPPAMTAVPNLQPRNASCYREYDISGTRGNYPNEINVACQTVNAAGLRPRRFKSYLPHHHRLNGSVTEVSKTKSREKRRQ